jgi:chlorobactene glucosyltransferase
MKAYEVAAFALVAGPAVAVAANVLVNLAVWPRGDARGRWPGRISVLIPARDEARSIEQCVDAALAATPGPHEVIVCDDGSTDGTAALVERIAARDPRVRLIRGAPLPPGWVGKPHASDRLATEAVGDLLVFVDADVVLGRETFARMASVFGRFRADAVSAGLRQRTVSFGERLVIPLLHLSYLAWLPLALVWRTSDPRMTVANGQLFAIRRDAYLGAGGWAGVRDQVVDDLAFGRAIKRAGLRLVFADGHRMAICRMYDGFGALRDGFSKNLYAGIGGTPAALAVVIVMHLWAFVVPYVALGAGLAGVAPVAAAGAVGVGANLLLRGAMAFRLRQPAEGVLFHPLAVLVLLGIALNSWRWSRAGRIRWRGREYGTPGNPAPTQ